MNAPLPLDLCEQAPEYIRRIAPYQPGKPISELAREMGLDVKSIVKLASNENPLGVSPAVRAAIQREFDELARYPDGNQFDLKSAISKRYNWPVEGIVVGNGSNDVLELAALALLGPGRSAVFAQHAFAVYPLATQARGAASIVVPAKNWGHDLDAMAAAVRADTKIVFVSNPNNPTGTFLPPAALAAFLAKIPSNVCVVLDEAYNEYLPPEHRFDSSSWLRSYPNLLIVRTLSKIYGLASLRVGFGLVDPRLADLINRVRQPFNVNSLALAAAVAALGDTAFVQKSYEINRAGMQQLEAGFKRLGLAYIPSFGNFITVELPRQSDAPQAGVIYQKLLKQGVIVRPVAGYGMPDHLRISIGLPQENERFLVALAASLDRAPA
jgi:histidinol-phosphate aminotransferase